MTRDRRTGLDVLNYDECLGLLARAPIGRVGVHLPDHPPVIFPINYAFDRHNIVFRTDASNILHQARQYTVACEIDGIDRIYHLGWSVLIVGQLEAVTDRSEHAALATLPVGPLRVRSRDRHPFGARRDGAVARHCMRTHPISPNDLFWNIDYGTNPQLAAARPAVHVVDMNHLLCPDGPPGGCRTLDWAR